MVCHCFGCNDPIGLDPCTGNNKMAPRNPSELARLEDELCYWKTKVGNLCLSKSSREAALAEVRKIERQLGLESEDYNG